MYKVIADLFKRGQIVPFLGAGVNTALRPRDAKWQTKSCRFLPSGSELSRFLAELSGFPAEDDYDLNDLAKVASYFVTTIDRFYLFDNLHAIFNRNYKPGSIHKYLAEICRRTPLLIVTTNYDDLTERAFDQARVPYDLVIHPTEGSDKAASVFWWRYGEDKPREADPNRLRINLNSTTVIYKMHGTVDRRKRVGDSYVITEEDYIQFLSRMIYGVAVPTQFMLHFSRCHFLFLGYGLRDWNLRLILNNLKLAREVAQPAPKKKGARRPVPQHRKDPGGGADGMLRRSWAIQRQPSGVERALWEARKVTIYDADIDEFVKRLQREGA